MTSGSANIPDEDFNLYHAVDRQIFIRLTVNLTRAPDESVHVMAFLMWFQSEICQKKGVLAKLLDLSDGVVNEIANECVSCLKCVVTEIAPFTDGVYEIVLLPKLMGLNVTLQVLHEHRFEVIDGVKRFAKDVCVRVFKDIFAKVSKGKFASPAPASAFNPKLFVKVGSENMVKTPARSNEGIGLLKSSSDHGGIFAASVNDKGRNPAAAIVSRAAGGFNDGPPGIEPLKMTDIGGEESCMDELRKIFTPLNRKKFGQTEDHPGGNRISPVLPTLVRNNSNTTGRAPPPPLQLLAGSFKPYHPLSPATSVGYAVLPSPGHQRGLPTGQLTSTRPVSSWANSTPGNANGYAIIPPNPPPQQPNFLSYNQLGGGVHGGRPDSTNNQLDYGNSNDIDDLLPDDRTIFLTFSKGYPIAASDIKDYFTRKFGDDVIEQIYMQIVRPLEQVLYARMVCSSPSVVETITRGGKVRYNINGRHCRARKYVKKIRN